MPTGGYEIISGHRRRAAVRLLLDRGENISRLLPCLVQSYTDDDARLLDIVLMNVSARQISDAELWQSYELLDRILKEKKTTGERFGRVREKLSELLGVSPAQIGKMQNVTNNAIPDVVAAVQTGEISISTANEIAKMDKEAQEALVQQGDLGKIKHKDVKAKNQKPAPVKVDICSTNPEDEAEPVEAPAAKVDTCSTNPEDEAEPVEAPAAKVDTCSTNPEDEVEPVEAPAAKVDTCSTNPEDEAEPVEAPAAKVDTCSTNPEDEAEPVEAPAAKVDTCSTKPADPLTAFVYDHYYDLEAIFTTYTSMADSDEEIRLLETLQEYLRCIRESERQRQRLLGGIL